eukprot:TRINITY_DN17095_c0_g1_i1.p1 TRINITY_DN17095_c0_g1~~TRINITY_DN17095_c0_g1_i1.p1  ORF type:complete len:584 (-),score=117.53 TRINITY_DN17095_c0_g1_i1:947-2698(-)
MVSRSNAFLRYTGVVTVLILLMIAYQDFIIDRVLVVSNASEGVLHDKGGSPTHLVSTKQLMSNVAFEISFLRSNSLERMDAIVKDISELKASDAHKQEAMEEEQKRAAEQLQALEAGLKMQVAGLEGTLLKEQKALETLGKQMEAMETTMKAQQHRAKEADRLKLRKDILLHGDPSEWRPDTFVPHSTYGFVQFSSYRVDVDEFVTIGLGAYHLHATRQGKECRWVGKDGKEILGKISFTYNNEHHQMRYEAMIVHCQLDDSTNLDGGYLIGTIDDEEVILINEKSMPPWEGKSPFKYKFLHCSPPMFGTLDPRAIREWMDFHRVTAGFDHFIMYDMAALDEELKEAIKEYLDGGWVTVVDFAPALSYEVWWWAQAVGMWDCMFRARPIAKWVAMMDFDEYLQAYSPNTVGSFLRAHEDKAWITHGVVWWGIDSCLATERGRDKAKFVEEMTFRWPDHYCMHKDKFSDWRFCLDHYGHRKLILNPRKVWCTEIHLVTDPLDGGHNANSGTELVHNHYQGVAAKVHKRAKGFVDQGIKERCSKERVNTEDAWWVYDPTVKELSESRVTNCPITDRVCVETIFDD